MNKRFTVEESNLISIFMEEGIDSDVGGRKKVINGIDKALYRNNWRWEKQNRSFEVYCMWGV